MNESKNLRIKKFKKQNNKYTLTEKCDSHTIFLF